MGAEALGDVEPAFGDGEIALGDPPAGLPGEGEGEVGRLGGMEDSLRAAAGLDRGLAKGFVLGFLFKQETHGSPRGDAEDAEKL